MCSIRCNYTLFSQWLKVGHFLCHPKCPILCEMFRPISCQIAFYLIQIKIAAQFTYSEASISLHLVTFFRKIQVKMRRFFAR